MMWLRRENYLAPIRRISKGLDFVHLARVRFGHQTITAYVKLSPPDRPGTIAAEAVGWMLAKRLPRARRACLIDLDLSLIHAAKPPVWVHQLEEPVVAWCCQAIPADSLQSLVENDEGNEDRLWCDVLDSEEGPSIAGLDHWAANDDRHGGNLLRLSANHWSVIDHGRVFGRHDWPAQGPAHQVSTYLVRQARRHLAGAALRDFTANVIHASEEHADVLMSSVDNIRVYLDRLHGPESAQRAIDFLTQRQSREWMAAQFGEIG